MQATQLSLFDKKPRKDRHIIVGGKEYRPVNLLGPQATCERFDMLINDVLCEGYDCTDNFDEIYFPTEDIRNRYKQLLDEVCETDKMGNNLDGWYDIGDHQDGKFIHGIKRNWNESIENGESPICREIIEKIKKELDKKV